TADVSVFFWVLGECFEFGGRLIFHSVACDLEFVSLGLRRLEFKKSPYFGFFGIEIEIGSAKPLDLGVRGEGHGGGDFAVDLDTGEKGPRRCVVRRGARYLIAIHKVLALLWRLHQEIRTITRVKGDV